MGRGKSPARPAASERIPGLRGRWHRAGTKGSPCLGTGLALPPRGRPRYSPRGPGGGEKLGAPPTAFPTPGAVSAAMRPRSSPVVPAAAAKGPRRAEPALLSRSSARLPPCEISRPPRRAPGPPCRSGEDAAGKPPHLAGLLGAGDEIPSLCRPKEVIFLAEIYIILFFFPAPFRQCFALLGALALTLSLRIGRAPVRGREYHELGVFLFVVRLGYCAIFFFLNSGYFGFGFYFFLLWRVGLVWAFFLAQF